jgi:glycosyltransferase involved in cell wall biosynthesis
MAVTTTPVIGTILDPGSNSCARPRILVLTDRIGPASSNGSQVLATALLETLTQWFDINTVALTDSSTTYFAVGAFDDLSKRFAILPTPDLIYNLGGTQWSCAAALAAHRRWPAAPVLNHFQLNLAVYADTEKWPAASCMEQAQLQRDTALAGDLNVFPSFAELDLGRRVWAIPSGMQASVVPNAFVPAKGMTAQPRETGDRFTFLVCGRLSDRVKGADMLYRAYGRIAAAESGTRLEIVTNGARFTQLLRSLPAGSWTLREWATRDELHAAMRAADILVVPSRYEPFGMVAVEAMAMETPVIAMGVGGLAETVHHGVSGWLCDPSEGSFGLATAMRAALRMDRSELRALGQNGAAIVRLGFSLDQMVCRIRRLIDDLLCTHAMATNERGHRCR